MPVWFAVTAVAAGVSLYSKERSAKKAKGAAHEQAKLYEMQADRILEEASENIRNVKIQGEKLEGQQIVAYAANGIDISSGSALAVMDDTNRQINGEISSIQRASKFQADLARSGADQTRAVADDIRKGQAISNYASFAGSVASAGTDYAKYAKAAEANKALAEANKRAAEANKTLEASKNIQQSQLDLATNKQAFDIGTKQDPTQDPQELRDFFKKDGVVDENLFQSFLKSGMSFKEFKRRFR